MTLEEAVIKAFAKKRGISEEEAAAYIEALREEKGDEEFEKMIQNLIGVAEAAKNLDPNAQQLLIAAALQPKSTGDDWIAKIAALKAAFGSDEDEIRELKEQIKELVDSKQKSEYMQMIEDLKAQIEALQAQLSSQQQGSDLSSFIQQLSQIEQQKRELRKALGLPEEEEKKLDLNKAIEELKKLGYEIKEPTAALLERIEELERKHEQEIEEVRRKTKEEVLRQVNMQKMWMDFGASILNAVLSLTTPSEKSGVAEAIKKALGALKQSQ